MSSALFSQTGEKGQCNAYVYSYLFFFLLADEQLAKIAELCEQHVLGNQPQRTDFKPCVMKIQADIGIGKLPDISYIQATYYFQGCADINYKYITLLSYVS